VVFADQEGMAYNSICQSKGFGSNESAIRLKSIPVLSRKWLSGELKGGRG